MVNPALHHLLVVLDELMMNSQGWLSLWWTHLPSSLITEVDDLCISIALHEGRLSQLPLAEAHTSVMVYEVLCRDMKVRVREWHEAYASNAGRQW